MADDWCQCRLCGSRERKEDAIHMKPQGEQDYYVCGTCKPIFKKMFGNESRKEESWEKTR